MGRLWKKRDVALSFGVDRDLFRIWWVNTEVVVDWGALDSYRWLLGTRKMGDWRLVESSAGVDVDCVEYVVVLLR
jgi:hypothetical protein